MKRLRILLVLPAVAMLMTVCVGGGSRGSAISLAASAYIAGRVVDMGGGQQLTTKSRNNIGCESSRVHDTREKCTRGECLYLHSGRVYPQCDLVLTDGNPRAADTRIVQSQ